MTNRELEIILKLRDEFTKRLTGIRAGIARFAKTIRQEWINISTFIKDVFQMARKAWEELELVAKVKQQAQAFKSLAASYGESASKIIKELRDMSGQTISTMNLMQQASKAITLGIDPSKLGRLMEISRAAARAMGQDVSFMFESIATGIGRQSRLILDNLGIIVKMESAYENYARKLNKTAKELSEAEKRQAFLNEVLEKGQNIIKRVDMSATNQLEAMQKLSASFEDAKINATLYLNELLKLDEVFKFWSEFTATHGPNLGDVLLNEPQINLAKERIREIKEELASFGELRPGEAMFGLAGILKGTIRVLREASSGRIEDLKEELSLMTDVLSRLEMEKEITLDIQKARGEELKAAQDRERLIEDLSLKIKTIRMKETQFQIEELQKEVEAWKKAYASDGEVLKIVKEFYDLRMKEINEKSKQEFKAMEEFAKEAARNIQDAFAEFFFDVFSGELDNAKELFEDFGRTMLKTIANIIAQLLVVQAIKAASAAFPGLGNLFALHQGGMLRESMALRFIPRAHSGMILGRDEVPFVGLKGEGVLNKEAMSLIGEAGLNKLNRGQMPGQQIIINNYHINYVQAMDAKSFRDNLKKHGDIYVSAQMEGILKNQDVRHVTRNLA